MKRNYISIFLTLVLIGLVAWGFIALKKKRFESLDPFLALGNESILIFETDKFREFTALLLSSSQIWKEFQSTEIIKQTTEIIQWTDSIIKRNEKSVPLNDLKFVLSLQKSHEGYALLLLVSPTRNSGYENLLKVISTEEQLTRRKLNGVSVYDLRPRSGKPFPLVSFFEKGNLLAISNSGSCIEQAIQNLEKEEGGNPEFSSLRALGGKEAAARLYINHSGCHEFLATKVLNKSTIHEIPFSGWSVLDIGIDAVSFTMNGLSREHDSLVSGMELLSGQNAQEFDAFSVIPSNTVWISLAGFSGAQSLSGKLNQVNTGRSRGEPDQLCNCDFYTEFASFAGNEAGEVILDNKGTSDHYFILEVKAKSPVLSFLHLINNENLPEGETGENKVFRSGIMNIPSLLFEPLIMKKSYEYYAFAGNFLIFSETAEAVNAFLYQAGLGKTLANDEYFSSLSNHLASRSNIFRYFNPGKYFELLQPDFSELANSIYKLSAASLAGIGSVSIQGTNDGKLQYLRAYIHYSGERKEFVNTVWQRKMDSRVITKPAIVLNHLNGQKEILVQDESGRLYLMANDGRILWKQQLDGTILGEVLQIDYYRNGKLQYIFNTREKVYIIDRNGNPVEKFPLALPSTATAGLSLFDYEKDGTLRICVPCGKSLLMYDKNGMKLPGFSFSGADHEMRHPPQHIRINDKDYIVTADPYNVYMLDRRGKPRVRPSSGIAHSAGNPLWPDPLAKRSDARILTTDTTGTIYQFYFDGRVKKLFNPGLPAVHFFIPSDLNGDGALEYIFCSGNMLKVYGSAGELRFEKEFAEPISLRPVVYEFSAQDKKIGIVESENGNIFLLNSDGSVYLGFPLKGNGLFSISSFPGLNARFNLIVGSRDNFLYNYSVK